MQVKKKRGRPKGSKNKNSVINNITERKSNKSIAPIQLYYTVKNIRKESIIKEKIDLYFCQQFNQQVSSELCNARASDKNLHYDFRITENKICNKCITDNNHISLKQLLIKSNKIIPDILKPIIEDNIIDLMITIEDKTYIIEGI